MNVIRFFIIILLLQWLVSCRRGDASTPLQAKAKDQPVPVFVRTMPAVSKTFYHELVCNGIVEAAVNACVGFETSGVIDQVLVQSGQMVRKGELLARLFNQSQQIALERARNTLSRAKVDLADIMIIQSAKGDTSKLSAQMVTNAKVKSGYADAELSLREAELQLAKTYIVAPISGRIVDLKAKPHNPTGSYDYLCRIIDEESLQVSFNILESELSFATLGTEIESFPFSSPQLAVRGVIVSVNRMVDANGMVRVVARLNNPPAELITGMNVRVLVKRPEPGRVVIPAEGLTKRQNKDVVFLKKDSLASWKYVKIGARNSSEVVVLEGVKPGDVVIVGGNATIGHDAWVKEEEE